MLPTADIDWVHNQGRGGCKKCTSIVGSAGPAGGKLPNTEMSAHGIVYTSPFGTELRCEA